LLALLSRDGPARFKPAAAEAWWPGDDHVHWGRGAVYAGKEDV
jgi:hypothetical protein